MKQITKQKKDQNGAEFSSSEKQLLNKKRRKLTKDNIKISNDIKIQKRRLYDVINVLQGK